MYRTYLIAALIGLIIPAIYFGGYWIGLNKINNKKNYQAEMKPSATPKPSKPKEEVKWGVFAGGEVNDFVELANKLNTKGDFLPAFVHWGNENQFPQELGELAKKDNQTLVIYWEAMDYNAKNQKQDNRYAYDAILEGKWDEYIRSFASEVKVYGRDVIIIPFEEMNGEWYPWSIVSNHNSGEKHIKAYRHLKSFFADNSKAKFGWVINHDTVPDEARNRPLNYYPGNEYVDYIGINGFNFDNPWMSFGEIFDQAYEDMKGLGKPIMIFSMASAEGERKAQWIAEASSWINGHDVVGWIWFNENKEKDWRIWSDENSLNTFREKLIPQKVDDSVNGGIADLGSW